MRDSDERIELETDLKTLLSILQRLVALEEEYEATVQRYTPTLKPLPPSDFPKWAGALVGFVLLFTGKPNLIMGFGIICAVLGVVSIFLLAHVRAYAIGLLICAAGIIATVIDASEKYGVFLLLALLPAAFFLITGLVNGVLVLFKRKTETENEMIMARAEQEAAPKLLAIEQQVDATRRQYHQGGYTVPEAFLTIDAVADLLRIVHTHQADTLMGAINVLKQEERHNQQMQMLQENVAAQERTARAVDMASILNVGSQAFQGSLTRSTISQQGEKTRNLLRHYFD